MQRYLSEALRADLGKKILLLSGPRQSGKTTLARMLEPDHQYLSFDFAEHRLLLREKSWDRSKAMVVLDELHKMPQWKVWLKGIYDVEGMPPALVVTGSVRLGAFRKVGDSLAGRHFAYRLHPVDLKEAISRAGLSREEAYTRLLAVGGFPEPFLNGTSRFYNRWKRSHIDQILREDLLTLSAVRDIHAIETLIELLRSRVGSPVSSNSLARDLQKSPATVQNWLKLLEDLFVVFRVSPFHRNIARALTKEPKYYFFDTAMVQGDPGARLENLVACALLKECHRAGDVDGEDYDLHHLRTKDGRELDFLVTHAKRPHLLVEVKWSDTTPSPHFRKLLAQASLRRVQLVGEMTQAKSYPDGTRIEPAASFLAALDLGAPTTR